MFKIVLFLFMSLKAFLLFLMVVLLRNFFEKSDDLSSELYLGLFYGPSLKCFIILQDFKSV